MHAKRRGTLARLCVDDAGWNSSVERARAGAPTDAKEGSNGATGTRYTKTEKILGEFRKQIPETPKKRVEGGGIKKTEHWKNMRSARRVGVNLHPALRPNFFLHKNAASVWQTCNLLAPLASHLTTTRKRRMCVQHWIAWTSRNVSTFDLKQNDTR